MRIVDTYTEDIIYYPGPQEEEDVAVCLFCSDMTAFLCIDGTIDVVVPVANQFIEETDIAVIKRVVLEIAREAVS